MVNPEGKSKAEKQYALWLGDVVGVGVGENGSNSVYTLASKRRPKSVSLYIKEEDDEEDEEEGDASNSRSATMNGTSTRPGSAKKSGLSNGELGDTQELLGRGHRRAIIEQKTRVSSSFVSPVIVFQHVFARVLNISQQPLR